VISKDAAVMTKGQWIDNRSSVIEAR